MLGEFLFVVDWQTKVVEWYCSVKEDFTNKFEVLPVVANPYKIEVIITSFIEVLELPNFGHMTKSRIKFESRDKFLLMTS